MKTTISAVVLVLFCNFGLSSVAWGQARESEIVTSATYALNELMAIPGKNLTRSMVAKAQGIVIVPVVFSKDEWETGFERNSLIVNEIKAAGLTV